MSTQPTSSISTTWKTAPFIRLLIPFILGILLQRMLHLPISFTVLVLVVMTPCFFIIGKLSAVRRFTVRVLPGIFLFVMLLAAGSFVYLQNDIRQQQQWIGNSYHENDGLVAYIDEPLLEKKQSYKAVCHLETLLHGNEVSCCKGNIIIYFQKDSLLKNLHYGDRILFYKNLQPIRNSNNPGGFDYQRYASFQQLYHTVYLKKQDFVVLNESRPGVFNSFLFAAREKLLGIIRNNIPGEEEKGLAEALLIGYKEDLDKDLVQAYSNTGVVHIIAISGLHLGLIYLMLAWVFNRIPWIKKMEWTKALLILSCLWLFTLLTGASASVLRSAVMFSFIIPAKLFGRRSTMINSLAASALVLLLYDPYFLWDVGFQLSYLAVAGIVIFQEPVYKMLYIKHKWPDQVWKMASVSIAAQLLTFPVCLYYFHQFPNYFLLANIVAVPLSSLILAAEVMLLAFGWWQPAAALLGKACQWGLWLMNKFIGLVDALPGSLWDGIPATTLSTMLLYASVICICYGIRNAAKNLLKVGLIATLLFFINHAIDAYRHSQQEMLIVYNVPQYRAIDIIRGNSFCFRGDSLLKTDGLLQHFHLKPSRIFMQADKQTDAVPGIFEKGNFMQWQEKRLLFIDRPVFFRENGAKMNVDIIVLSKNPKLYIAGLQRVFNAGLYVFDASNPLWKIEKWKKECEELHLRCYSVPDEGAFITGSAR